MLFRYNLQFPIFRTGDGEANGQSELAAGGGRAAGGRAGSPIDGHIMTVCPKPVFKSLFR